MSPEFRLVVTAHYPAFFGAASDRTYVLQYRWPNNVWRTCPTAIFERLSESEQREIIEQLEEDKRP